MNKFTKVINELKRHKNFLITAHINPEGDAIGSQLAFMNLLKGMKKNAHIVNSQKVPFRYKFLPGSNKILTSMKKGIKYDAVCFLDCADIKRIGEISKKIDLSKPKINIDHHISNVMFGDINLVDTHVSSTAEILYTLFKEAKIKISKEVAICLYTAILVDTGSFSYSNVKPFTHRIVSDLINIGINTNRIYRKVYEEIPPATMRLLGGVLSTLKLSRDGKIAWMHISKDMLKSCRARLQDEEDFVNFPRIIKNVEVALLFTEIAPRKIKISLRSNYLADVNKIASRFGGGGHKKASGCIIEDSLKDAEKKLISEAEKHV